MTIRLHIERLVLDGVILHGAERARLERSLVAELTDLLAAAGTATLLAEHGALASVRAPDLRVQTNASGAAIGTSIAHSLRDSLVPPEPSIVRSETPSAPSRRSE